MKATSPPSTRKKYGNLSPVWSAVGVPTPRVKAGPVCTNMGVEAKIEAACRKALLEYGGALLKLQGTTGWPDRLAILPNGVHFFVEFKRPGGALSPIQRYVMGRLKALGHEAFEVDNVALFKRLVNERL